MKLQVRVTKTREEYCTIEVPNLESAGNAIKELYNDDFQEIYSYYNVSVVDEDGEDITGAIQPYTPNIAV